MTIAHLDCFSGVSGNMLLGALLDCGLDRHALETTLAGLGLEGWRLTVERVRRGPIECTLAEVEVSQKQPPRNLQDILELFHAALLAPVVAERAERAFRRLGEAEAAVHGVPVGEVHFHEVGAVDAIIDIVGAAAGVHLLGLERVTCSPLPLGGGWVDSSHGRLPIPAPATVRLLEGYPAYAGPVEAELVTPTGAALVTSLCEAFGAMPPMTVKRVGYGAGGRDLAQHPNCLRLLIGEAATAPSPDGEPLLLLETNVDDMNPEVYEHVMERLFAAGALDVFITPIIMKKSRPGTLLTALVPPARQAEAAAIIFRETTTLGLRVREVTRHCLEREWLDVQTPYGQVRVKVARMAGDAVTAAPEYEDCKRLAREQGVALKQIYDHALAAALTRLKG